MKKLLSLTLLIFFFQLTLSGQESKQITIPKSYYLDQVIQVEAKGYLLIMTKGTYQTDQGTMILKFFSPENEPKWEATINKSDIDKLYVPKDVNIVWTDNYIYFTVEAAEGIRAIKNKRLVIFQFDIETGKAKRKEVALGDKQGEMVPISCTDTEVRVIHKDSKAPWDVNTPAKFYIHSFEMDGMLSDQSIEIQFPPNKTEKTYDAWIYLGEVDEQFVFYKKCSPHSYQLAFIAADGKLQKELYLPTGLQENETVVPMIGNHYNQKFIPKEFDVKSTLAGSGQNSYVVRNFSWGAFTDIYLHPASKSIYITGKFSSAETTKDGAFFLTKYNIKGDAEWHKKMLHITYKSSYFWGYDFYIDPGSMISTLSYCKPERKKKYTFDEYNFNPQGDSIYTCKITSFMKTEKSTVKTKAYYNYGKSPSIKDFYLPSQLNAYSTLEGVPYGEVLFKAKELALKTEAENPFYYFVTFGSKAVIVEHLANHDRINLYSFLLK